MDGRARSMQTRMMGRSRVLVGVIAVLALGFTACSEDEPATPAATAGGASEAAPDEDALEVSAADAGDVGTVLVDADGFTLYLFTPEKGGTIACTKQCLDFWPALTIESNETTTAANGVDASLLGTTERPEGDTQVTYNGWPLYTFSGDEQPGQANGQGVEGNWFAMTVEGEGAA
jgi:predicted lipoprotein with Yx(FWY)xxD motif